LAVRRFLNENPIKYKKMAMILLAVNVLYLSLLLTLYSEAIPLLMVFNGEGITNALAGAKLQHLGGSGINIPYVSKFFDFLNFFLPLLILLLYLRKSTSVYVLFLVYASSFIYLSLELQKAPFLTLGLLTGYLVLILIDSVYKKLVGLVILFFLLAFVIYTYSFFMGKDFLSMIYYLVDRPVFGQIQGMYFMHEYYTPSMDAVFSKTFFSTGSSGGPVPPDVYIVDYVYPNSSHVVNVNTYFIGEAWSFAGHYGVALFTWAVAITLGFYIYFWSHLLSNYTHVTYLMALVFFTTIPINQSLQFIIYQKYFLYYLLFFVVPIFFLLFILRVKK
jgi:hypothetical protein